MFTQAKWTGWGFGPVLVLMTESEGLGSYFSDQDLRV